MADLDVMTWLHTEGGRKCPFCGRFAKPEQLGWVGGSGPGIIVDAYGHLPGFGCNAAPAPSCPRQSPASPGAAGRGTNE